jgi:hypothetical protein
MYSSKIVCTCNLGPFGCPVETEFCGFIKYGNDITPFRFSYAFDCLFFTTPLGPLNGVFEVLNPIGSQTGPYLRIK